MSLLNLKRKLSRTLATAAPQPPESPPDPASWPLPDEEPLPTDAEDEFEGEGWSFWGV